MMTLTKPRRGDYRIEQRERRASRVATEQAVMRAAVARDGGRCRWPGCEFARYKLPIDPVHFQRHRGMGGNPSGDRTESTGQIVALCRRHHDALDKFLEIDIEPLDSVRLADGPLVFYRRSESGRMEHIHTERGTR